MPLLQVVIEDGEVLERRMREHGCILSALKAWRGMPIHHGAGVVEARRSVELEIQLGEIAPLST